MKRIFPVFLTILLLVSVFAAAEPNHVHRSSYAYTPLDGSSHTVSEYCSDPDCGMELKRYDEEHRFSEGFCSKCGYACPHDSTHTESIPVEGENDYQWDGAYLTYTVLKITCCEQCGQELNREVKEEKILHETHTNPVHISYNNENDIIHTEKLACSLCGTEYTVSEVHEWTHISYFQEEETHTDVLRCNSCGAMKEIVQEHSYEQTGLRVVGDSGHIREVICTVCGMKRDMPLEEHQLSFLFWSGNEQGHWKYNKCDVCQRVVSNINAYEPHKMEGDEYKTCSVCGYSDNHWGHTLWESDIDGYIILDNKLHRAYGECDTCGGKIYQVSYHSFNPVTQVCDQCGYQRDDCLHDPVVTVNKEMASEWNHCYHYACKKCGKEWNGEMMKHTFRFNGYLTEKATLLTHTIEMECIFCGYKKITEQEHASEITITPEGHTVHCTECDYKKTEQHHLVGADKAECEFCGYVDHVHHWVLDHIGTHNTYCFDVFKCDHPGCPETKNGDGRWHDLDMADVTHIPIDLNDNVHKVVYTCPYCQNIIEDMQRESHTFGADHTCKICGYVHSPKFELKTDEKNIHHTWEECSCGAKQNEQTTAHRYVSEYTTVDETKHRFVYLCEICGRTLSDITENHDIEGGVCKLCGYGENTVNEELVPNAGDVTVPENGNVSVPDAGEAPALPAELQQLLKGGWFTLTVQGTEVSCTIALEKTEDSPEMTLVLLPEFESPEDILLSVTAESLRQMKACGVTQLKLELAEEILLAVDVDGLLDGAEVPEGMIIRP